MRVIQELMRNKYDIIMIIMLLLRTSKYIIVISLGKM